jgi:hypothetical protein
LYKALPIAKNAGHAAILASTRVAGNNPASSTTARNPIFNSPVGQIICSFFRTSACESMGILGIDVDEKGIGFVRWFLSNFLNLAMLAWQNLQSGSYSTIYGARKAVPPVQELLLWFIICHLPKKFGSSQFDKTTEE